MLANRQTHRHTDKMIAIVVAVKFFNENFVRLKVDNANIQTETRHKTKQASSVRLHNTNIQNSDLFQ